MVIEEPMTIAQWIDRVAGRLAAAELHYGHGTDNARDEAAWLVLHAADLPLDGNFTDWGRAVNDSAAVEIRRLVTARCDSGKPLAYLTGRAHFAGLEFDVTPAVLVPRSPLAELILDGFRPWLEPGRVKRVLDMCTGSGCIAIAVAHYLPRAQVDAVDISPQALEVAAGNVQKHHLSDRVRLIESDLFCAVPKHPYDLIVANPPYVPAASLRGLPREYRAEPGLGLASGEDGLDAALSIMVDAPRFLGEDGILLCEVGESDERLASVLPRIPFLWLEFEHGGSGVFIMSRQELESAGPDIAGLIGERENVA